MPTGTSPAESSALASSALPPSPLASARLYLCTDARRQQADFAQFVDAAFAGGVDIIQLRDKSLEAAAELELLGTLAEVAERHGKLWAVNDRADVAATSRAPVLHLGQADLPRAAARRIVGPAAAIGLSTHSADQIDAAIAEHGLDYFCVGPVWATPTKPGRTAVGLELVEYASSRMRASGNGGVGVGVGSSADNIYRGTARPWFAIGGIDHSNVARVVDAGARRIVVVRAITDATDPTDASRRLLSALPPVVQDIPA